MHTIGDYTMPRIITLLANVYAQHAEKHWTRYISTPCLIWAGQTVRDCTVVSASVISTRDRIEDLDREGEGTPLAGWYCVYTMALVVIAPDDLDAETLISDRRHIYRVVHGLGVAIRQIAYDTANPPEEPAEIDWVLTSKASLASEEPLVRFEDL